MKTLIYILRFLYIGFVCYSTAILTVIIAHLMLGIDPSDLEPFSVFFSFVIHVVILDVYIIQKRKFLKNDDKGKEHF